MKNRHHSNSKIALALLSSLFIAAALARMVGGTASAIALEIDSHLAQTSGDHDEIGSLSQDQISGILTDIRSKSEALERRESVLEERERSLHRLKIELDQNLAKLSDAERSLSSLIEFSKDAARQDVDQLVSVYENMKARDASKIFEEMDATFAAGLLSQMDPVLAAAIIQGLEPRTAYSVSATIAGRNMFAPIE